MTLFIDASALVAMIAREPDADSLASMVRDDGDPLWSAMTCWETVSSLRRSYDYTIDRARTEVETTAAVMPFRLVAIDERVRVIALDAYQAYGRNSGSRARLNMGDCFAYACARISGARLLYKGDDFIHTDLA